jgi:endonuclease YncB( thermonuclease family)
MGEGVVKALKIILLTCLFGVSSIASAEVITGIVVGITDGDTVTLLDAQNQQHKIRLAGIDAPEKNQPYGQASKKNLSDLAYQQTINADCSKADRYGRLICRLLVRGKDVNLVQVSDGFAWHYKKYESEQSIDDRRLYASAEEGARAAKRGLWQEPNAQAPWEWRHRKR